MKELSVPPSEPVRWRCTSRNTSSHCYVEARAWVTARDEACILLGCQRGDVECVMVEDTE